MPQLADPPRRRVLQQGAGAAAALAMPALWLGPRAAPPSPLRATPAQVEGPFYPQALPADHDHDLLRQGARRYQAGAPVWLDGSVRDLAGRPVTGALVEIWQCDAEGHYHHPGDGGRANPDFQGYGRVAADADGRYRFRTLRPAPYPGRTPHIHLKVRLGGRELLTTQLYVEGEARNARDFLWRALREDERAALTVPFVPGSDGLQARFPIVVAA